VGLWHAQRQLGWQPSRFLADRAEAERAFQLAQQLDSVNAAAGDYLAVAAQGLHLPRPGHAGPQPRGGPPASHRRRPPAQRPAGDAGPGPTFVALNPGALPARPRSPAELYQWVRRDEQYATLGANVVVKLCSESHARQPTIRAWAIIRRADRSHRLAGQRASRPDRRHTDRADRTSRPQQPQERELAADAR
jgi:hypothetical protein